METRSLGGGADCRCCPPAKVPWALPHPLTRPPHAPPPTHTHPSAGINNPSMFSSTINMGRQQSLATGLICAVSREYTVHSTEYHTVGGGRVCATCGVATKSRAVQAGRRCAAQAEHSRA